MNLSMLIRLTKKLAAVMNGVDVSTVNVGDVLELPEAAARMMIDEEWAVPADDAAPHLVVPPLSDALTD
jgi:hypothetical protein